MTLNCCVIASGHGVVILPYTGILCVPTDDRQVLKTMCMFLLLGFGMVLHVSGIASICQQNRGLSTVYCVC